MATSIDSRRRSDFSEMETRESPKSKNTFHHLIRKFTTARIREKYKSFAVIRSSAMTTLQLMIWLCVAGYGLHVLEEFVFDWQNWARNVLHLPAQWSDFYITNALVIVLGVVAAEIAPTWPAVALGFPALMLINATFFHVAPFVWTRGRFSPGLMTALLLFLPLGIQTIRTAHVDGTALTTALCIGALLMAAPIVFLKLKVKPYFDQTR